MRQQHYRFTHAVLSQPDLWWARLQTGAADAPPSPPPSGARTSGPKPPVRLLAIVGGVAAALGLGGWLLYQEEFRGLRVPDEPVASIPFEPGAGFDLTFPWDGQGFAFNNLWLVIDEAEAGPSGLVVQGVLRWDGSEVESPVEATLPGGGAHRVRSEGGKLSGWLFLGEEYRRASSTPILCTGTLSVPSGRIVRARMVVTRRQRPSDFLHF